MNRAKLPWIEEAKLPWHKSDNTYSLTIDLSVYTLDAVLKTCYLFLDQCYLFVEQIEEKNSQIKVYLAPLSEVDDLKELIGEFSNRLLWQEVRQKVAAETQVVRELIVAQALTEANMLDQDQIEADYNVDPLGIGK